MIDSIKSFGEVQKNPTCIQVVVGRRTWVISNFSYSLCCRMPLSKCKLILVENTAPLQVIHLAAQQKVIFLSLCQGKYRIIALLLQETRWWRIPLQSSPSGAPSGTISDFRLQEPISSTSQTFIWNPMKDLKICFSGWWRFDEDILLKPNSLSHHGDLITEDEELSPSLENFVVLTWLKLIHPDLPRLVKQRYGTELRSRTLA